MRILYITQWFEPEPAFKGIDFAAALREAGHEVEVVTGFPNYPGGKLFEGYKLSLYKNEVIKGIKVHRLFLYPSHNSSSLKRALNYFSFFVSTLIFGLLFSRRYDVTYVYHPPVTPALSAAIFCSIHRRPFLVEIQDLWPDSAAASGMANRHLVKALGLACNFVYRRAAVVVTQSRGMKTILEQRGVPSQKLITIFNWATYRPAVYGSSMPVSLPPSFSSGVNLVYGGNVGQAQNLEVLIDAAILARRENPKVRLHIFGDGIERQFLQQKVQASGHDNVVYFHQSVSRIAMDRIFDSADILVMHLKQDPLYLFTIPSKTQHYLACSKPIVAGLFGEAARIIEEAGCGLVSPPGDTMALAKNIVKLANATDTERQSLGSFGREYYERNMSFERGIQMTLNLLGRTVDGDV